MWDGEWSGLLETLDLEDTPHGYIFLASLGGRKGSRMSDEEIGLRVKRMFIGSEIG